MIWKSVVICAAAVVILAAGCAKKVRETQPAERQDGLFVTWEFTAVDRDGEPWTEAALIINGSQQHKHRVGVFYGKVRRILSAAEINPEMTGGTLSGFITVNRGRGQEVIVRYNEQLQRLIVAERPWGGSLPAGPYRGIKNIPVPEMKKEKIGF